MRQQRGESCVRIDISGRRWVITSCIEDWGMATKAKSKDGVIVKLKQAQALLAGLLPYSSAKLEIFPFLSRTIVSEMWIISMILAVAASGISFNLSKLSTSSTTQFLFVIGGFLGAAVFGVVVVLVGSGLVLEEAPRWQDGLLRISFLFFFVGIGVVLGWLASVLFENSAKSLP